VRVKPGCLGGTLGGIAIVVVRNALIDWKRVDQRRHANHLRKKAKIEAIYGHHSAEAQAGLAEQWYKAAHAAEQARLLAEEAADAIDMATSRARHVLAKASSIAETYGQDSFERAQWLRRHREAQAALAEQEKALVFEIACQARSAREALAKAQYRDQLRRELGLVVRTLQAGKSALQQRQQSDPDIQEIPRAPIHRALDQIAKQPVEVTLVKSIFGYDAEILAKYGIEASDLVDLAVQRRLRALHVQQRTELAIVYKLADRQFALSNRSDTPYLRSLKAKWRKHPEVVRRFSEALQAASQQGHDGLARSPVAELKSAAPVNPTNIDTTNRAARNAAIAAANSRERGPF